MLLKHLVFACYIHFHQIYSILPKCIEVKVDPRKVTIESFEITKIELPTIEFKVVCSTGTYIRSLVKDFGEALEVGAYMSSLRRTRIGEFNVEDAKVWQDIEAEVNTLLEGKY